MKRCTSLILGILLLSSCSTVKRAPTSEAVAVSSSPALTLSPCQQIEFGSWVDGERFLTKDGREYQLLGVESFSNDSIQNGQKSDDRLQISNGEGQNFGSDVYERIAEEAYCIKTEPALERVDAVYLFTNQLHLLNGEIIRAGLGMVSEEYSYTYHDYLKQVEAEAGEAGSGVWVANEAPTQYSPPFPVVTPSEIAEREGEYVTLRMQIASTGRTANAMFWNSEADYRSTSNVAVVLPLPISHINLTFLERQFDLYVGSAVDVSGLVRIVDGKPQVHIQNRSQVYIAG